MAGLKRLYFAVATVFFCFFMFDSACAQLIGLYRFNDPSDTSVAIDASASANDGSVLGGAFYTPDMGGITGAAGDYAMDFGAGSSRVTLPAAPLQSISTNNTATMSMWLFGQGQPVSDTTFSFNQSGARQFMSHTPWGDGNVYFDTGGGAGGTQRISGSAGPASNYEDQWNHWTFIKDGDTKSIYLNGNLFLGPTGGQTAAIGAFNEAVIGAERATGANDYSGLIDDFAIFDTALTQSQIQDIMGGDFSEFGVSNVVPEPSSVFIWSLLAAALAGFGYRRYKTK